MNFNKIKNQTLGQLTKAEREALFEHAWDWNIDIRDFRTNTKVSTILKSVEANMKGFQEKRKTKIMNKKIKINAELRNIKIEMYNAKRKETQYTFDVYVENKLVIGQTWIAKNINDLIKQVEKRLIDTLQRNYG